MRNKRFGPYCCFSFVLHIGFLVGFSHLFVSEPEISFADSITSVRVSIVEAVKEEVVKPIEEVKIKEEEVLVVPEKKEKEVSSLKQFKPKPKPKKIIEPKPLPPVQNFQHVNMPIDNFGGMGESRLERPVITRNPKPPYPYRARRAGFEGEVLLEIDIEKSGRVGNATILKTSGRSDCDESARKTILERWKFTPAKRFGMPVATIERILVEFRLR